MRRRRRFLSTILTLALSLSFVFVVIVYADLGDELFMTTRCDLGDEPFCPRFTGCDLGDEPFDCDY